jgi:GNAT superfamily N-acetyltransferase
VPPFTVEELVVPVSVDATDAADFVASSTIMNEVEAEAYGHRDLSLAPAEVLPWWQDSGNPHRLFGVRIDGEIVGCGVYEYLASDPAGCWLLISVLPMHRGRGVGTALTRHIEAQARTDGRSKLLSYFPSPNGPGDRIDAPTGFGSVPASNAEVRFALGRGFRLEQVERGSRLMLPVAVEFTVPADYRVHQWIGPTPPEWLEQMAVLNTRMSTDAPSAGLDEAEDLVTPERQQELDAATARDPRSFLFSTVEHVPTGVLAGYTCLAVPAEPHRAVNQYATLVLKEHRGHKLGMLLKLANLDHLQRERPGHPSVTTFNAEENRYMLDVNEKVGFVPMGYEGAWRKDL